MLKSIMGWLRQLFQPGLKKARRKPSVEWVLQPYSFKVDWYVSTDEQLKALVDAQVQVAEASSKRLRDALNKCKRPL